MVLLTVTPAAKVAVDHYITAKKADEGNHLEETTTRLKLLQETDVGSPIDHNDLIDISKYLLEHYDSSEEDTNTRQWRLETLLKGANVYQPPPPPKKEPTSDYTALMKRLRQEEEQRQYERMINPPPPQETFSQRFPNASHAFNPATSIGQIPPADEVDEVTYADVNRQMALIINVLISIICCSIAIWIAARRWEVPQRLGLSMSGSGLVAVAEVAIYMGYIRRVQEAKDKEVKKVETKEVVETWVLDNKTSSAKAEQSEGARYRKGKHR